MRKDIKKSYVYFDLLKTSQSDIRSIVREMADIKQQIRSAIPGSEQEKMLIKRYSDLDNIKNNLLNDVKAQDFV